ncbi:MAG: ribosome biogenesis factor YjgA [Ghiorsea sp.]
MINLVDEDGYPEYERPNKSQLKREAQALQLLAQEMLEIHESAWPNFKLSSMMLDELRVLKEISQHGAKKRQLKRVAKLLREEDTETAQEAVDSDNKQHTDANISFHKIEQWRDKIIQGDRSVVTEFLSVYEEIDPQQFNQLVRHAKQESMSDNQHKYSKLLFKFLRSVIEA